MLHFRASFLRVSAISRFNPSRQCFYRELSVCAPFVLPAGRAATFHDGTQSAPFRLSQSFLDAYSTRPPPFGFNGLGEFVFATRYARRTPSGGRETWAELCARVVNGTYSMQKRWVESHGLGWDAAAATASAEGMFERMFAMKFLPPGRGLWAMGTPMTDERSVFAALNNCGFVSTVGIGDGGAVSATEPFCFLMDAAMLGVGVGFDTLGAGRLRVAGLRAAADEPPHVIADSREGWVDSLRLLLTAHFFGGARPAFDYSRVRPRGTPIKGFGGTASGPGVLRRLHEDVDFALSPLAGAPLSITAIVDIMNMIGRCIVSGDVRQTAEIAFGDPNSDEYIHLKDYTRNPARAAWGWTSNNTVMAPLGQKYDAIAERVISNGEPGFAWLENMRAYGRMGDAPNWKDARAGGGNPCLEQTLESFELCCLVETFPNAHADFDDFAETLKYAFLYAKTVTLGPTHWPSSNRVMLRNRRIGTSISGVAQFVAREGVRGLKEWCERGYDVVQDTDRAVSEWLAIPRSIKTTCVKPSGTVSLLTGASPGMHWPESRFYMRRVRLGRDHDLLDSIQKAGFPVEPAAEDPERKVVITFPVDVGAPQRGPSCAGNFLRARALSPPSNTPNAAHFSVPRFSGEGVRTLDQVSMWEQLSLAALLQRVWADNQVSCTVTFDPETEGPQLARALDIYQYQLKGVSCLPRAPTSAYPQIPYEAISEEQYRALVAKLRPLQLSSVAAPLVESPPDLFCDSEKCETTPT